MAVSILDADCAAASILDAECAAVSILDAECICMVVSIRYAECLVVSIHDAECRVVVSIRDAECMLVSIEDILYVEGMDVPMPCGNCSCMFVVSLRGGSGVGECKGLRLFHLRYIAV
jgi:hypothetical protein